MRIPRYVFTIRFCPLLALISTTGENSSLTIILVITLVQGFFTFFLNSILLLCLRFLWCGWQHWGILVNETTTILVPIDKPFMLNISTSLWVLRTPNAGRISHFQHFLCKNPKKSKNFAAKFSKKQFFLHFIKALVNCFIPQKWAFSSKKHVFTYKKLKMIISTSVWRAQHPNAGRNIQHIQHQALQLFQFESSDLV